MEQQLSFCAKLIAKHQLTIAFAESATAGWLCSEFALVPESGAILKGGIVCYDADLKQSLLQVPADIIKRFTPESQEVTDELARRLPHLIPADIHVGITGLTTPGGSETEEKPVGTMFIAVNFKNELHRRREVFNGSQEDIIAQTIRSTADLLISILNKNVNHSDPENQVIAKNNEISTDESMPDNSQQVPMSETERMKNAYRDRLNSPGTDL